jgi:hypothetical protein
MLVEVGVPEELEDVPDGLAGPRAVLVVTAPDSASPRDDGQHSSAAGLSEQPEYGLYPSPGT